MTTILRTANDRHEATTPSGHDDTDARPPAPVHELAPVPADDRPARDESRSRPPSRRLRRRLSKLVAVLAMCLAVLGVGVGGATSANALTIGTACSELYWNGAFYVWAPSLGGWVIVDRYYTPCVTGDLFNLNVRGTSIWWAVR